MPFLLRKKGTAQGLLSPACLHQWASTQCLACQEWSPHPIGMRSELRKNGTVLVGVSGTQLADMMAQMRKIIRCKKAKGDGIARADAANSFEFRGRQLRYNVSEVAIVSRPQRN